MTLQEKVDPKHTALVVVDVQNDFIHSEGAFGKSGFDVSLSQRMVPNLLRFIENARSVHLPIIHIKCVHGNWTNSPVWMEKWKDRTHGVCDTPWGADFYQISPRNDECIVTKHRYSAFIDTNLDLILRSIGTKTLLISGVATNVCVESTARDGFMKDYHIVFLEDCSAAYDMDEHKQTLKNIERYFGLVATSGEIVTAWRSL
ncbi:MAG: isochorismatase family cysteine hydrolase [bacterium]|nr:isochorismatase family cysteine hydrolase [bacterium]